MGRSTLVLLLAAALWPGCGAGPVPSARGHLGAGDLAAAVAAAGEHRGALTEVAISVLVAGLDDEGAREAAALGLEAAGEAARPALERALAEGGPAASCSAASALRRLGDEGVLARLEACLGEGDAAARAAAVRALGRGETVTVEALAGHLDDPEATVRAATVEAVARRGGEAAATHLVRTARDPAPSVRAAAVTALSRLGSPERAVELALAALSDPALSVRLAAVEALGRHAGRPEAARALAARLEEGSEGPEAVRAATHLALGGDAAARGHLSRLLAEGSPQDASAAAVGAGQVGEAMIEPLRAALERPEAEVRLHVAVALAAAGGSDAATAELSMLLGEAGWVGLRAAAVLVSARPALALDRLARALEEADPSARAYAAASASFAEDGLAVAREALADPVPGVRVAAADAVLRILGRRA